MDFEWSLNNSFSITVQYIRTLEYSGKNSHFPISGVILIFWWFFQIPISFFRKCFPFPETKSWLFEWSWGIFIWSGMFTELGIQQNESPISQYCSGYCYFLINFPNYLIYFKDFSFLLVWDTELMHHRVPDLVNKHVYVVYS